jgi:outer membrane receptor protein involved in Fe transport
MEPVEELQREPVRRGAPAFHRRLLLGLLAAGGLPSVLHAGTLSGSVVDSAGAPAAGEQVTARQGESETVTVTATRLPARLQEVPESVVVLDFPILSAAAAPALDAALRQVPGFSLFRRTDSRYANPTAQGVSLRGLGASGASRALVLADGVPLNDPFGGWVYWARLPREAVERVEVQSSGGSDLYGSPALAGVVNLVRRDPVGSAFYGEASGGSESTAEGSAFASVSAGMWRVAASGEAFSTGGYVAVPADQRGSVDTRVRSRHDSTELTVERSDPDAARIFLRGSYYAEDRANGTPLQRNDTVLRQASAGSDGIALGGSYVARAFAGNQELDQTFSSISADRNSETLTRAQRVPASSFGAALQWSRPLSTSGHTLVVGADVRDVLGESAEDVFVGPLILSSARGRQRSYGVFAEDLLAASERLTLQAGLRFDGWRSFDGREVLLHHESGLDSRADLAARDETAMSPRLGGVLRVSETVKFSVSAYRGFRAPTLNELYRSFRVGNVETEANPNLESERSNGAETAVSYAGGGVAARAALFADVVDHTIANVTVAATPQLITRVRENVGRTRTLGGELEAEARLASWRLTAGYLYADSRVVDFPADRGLEGRRVPQVPAHQATLGVLAHGALLDSAGLQARWVASQFEDDQNRLHLRPYFTLDAVVSRTVLSGLEAFLSVENVFDKRYETGRTPAVTVGPPRLFRGGFRLRK